MKKFFVAVIAMFFVLASAQAFAQDAPVPATRGEQAFESVSLKIANPIIVQLHTTDDPFLAEGRSDPVQVMSPAELLALQKTYGGIFIASTHGFCAAAGEANVTSYTVRYGLLSANVGAAIMHFYADVDFGDLVKPVAKKKWDENQKWLAKCSLVDDKKIVIEFGSST